MAGFGKRGRKGREMKIDKAGAYRVKSAEASPKRLLDLVRKGQVMGRKERIEALEERVTALEGEKPGRVFTETVLDGKAVAEAVNAKWPVRASTADEETVGGCRVATEQHRWTNEPAPEPSLWWFEDQFWVKDRVSRRLSRGDVIFDPNPFGGVMRLKGALRVKNGWAILRPAKTFPATDTRPELVESGEAKPPWRGDWYTAGGGIAEQCRQSFAPDDPACPILIPISEARKRCGVEGEKTSPLEAQAERDEEHARRIQAERDLEFTERQLEHAQSRLDVKELEEDLSTAERNLAKAMQKLVEQRDRAEQAEARVKWLEDRCRRADDQWEERARVFQGRVMEAEARVKELEPWAGLNPVWMRERLQRYTGSPEHVDTLVNLIRDWPDAPLGVRLDNSLREQLREALEPFGVGDGKAVRHEGVGS